MTLRGYYRLAAEAKQACDRAVVRSTRLFDALDRWRKVCGLLATERFQGPIGRASTIAMERMRSAQIARNEARFRMLFDREAAAQAQCEREARLYEEMARRRELS